MPEFIIVLFTLTHATHSSFHLFAYVVMLLRQLQARYQVAD